MVYVRSLSNQQRQTNGLWSAECRIAHVVMQSIALRRIVRGAGAVLSHLGDSLPRHMNYLQAALVIRNDIVPFRTQKV